ncbi:MAG: hypothetical protein Q8M51_07450 [Polaromonas sp.]|nr:hypothetical protein [Polaromonas sp.]MDP3355679.1 hypothetical protein [Polaromonas sp.]MDP3750887.1 hypothetical protein [Polaromonas sp.]
MPMQCTVSRSTCKSGLIRWPGLACVLALALILGACARPPPVIPALAGVVWQPDNTTLDPRGNWHRMGATELLVQWTAVDGMAFVDNPVLPVVPKLPAWPRIAGEAWAQDVILGLAGRFDEKAARADIGKLAEASVVLAGLPTPLKVTGWYFPVEIDPTWVEAPSLAPLLASLPRPLWISVYDSANVGPDALVQGLAKWLPPDVGVFFQDGVGVHAREARIAKHYADALSAKLGRERVRIIAEAFRPQTGGGFRSATIGELAPQLALYAGYRIYLFDGPHYVPDSLTAEIAAAQVPAQGAARP